MQVTQNAHESKPDQHKNRTKSSIEAREKGISSYHQIGGSRAVASQSRMDRQPSVQVGPRGRGQRRRAGSSLVAHQRRRRVPEPSSSMHCRCRNGTESRCAEELGTISRRTESGRADRCGSLRADRRLRLRRSTGWERRTWCAWASGG